MLRSMYVENKMKGKTLGLMKEFDIERIYCKDCGKEITYSMRSTYTTDDLCWPCQEKRDMEDTNHIEYMEELEQKKLRKRQEDHSYYMRDNELNKIDETWDDHDCYRSTVYECVDDYY